MTAAMGLNTSTIEDPRVKKKALSRQESPEPKSATTPSFAVTQALVGLLAHTGGAGIGKGVLAAECPLKGKSFISCLQCSQKESTSYDFR